MTKARLVAFAGAATLVLALGASAAVVPVRAATPLATRPPAAVVATSSRTPRADDFSTYLLGAGRYVLAVGSFAHAQQEVPASSPVPLPGALWLFASALFVFLGISVRRS